MDIDDLVEQLLFDVAITGSRGLGAEEIDTSIQKHYQHHHCSIFTSAPNDESNEVPTDTTLATSVPDLASFSALIFHRLEDHPDLDVSRAEEDKLPQLDGCNGAPNSSTISTSTPSWVNASEERIWQALTGHSVDDHRVPPKLFELLEVVAAAGPEGILQPEARQLTGQDKQSVPMRTDKLALHGYIVKERVAVPKMTTSRLRFWRFARQDASSPRDGSRVRERFDYATHFESMIGLLKSNGGIATTKDIQLETGCTEYYKRKTLNRCIGKLEGPGMIRKVKAKVEGEIGIEGSDRFARCIQLLREPNDSDRQIFMGGSGPVKLDSKGRTRTQLVLMGKVRRRRKGNARVLSDVTDSDSDGDAEDAEQQEQQSITEEPQPPSSNEAASDGVGRASNDERIPLNTETLDIVGTPMNEESFQPDSPKPRKKRRITEERPLIVQAPAPLSLGSRTGGTNTAPEVFFRPPSPQKRKRGRPRKSLIAVFKSGRLMDQPWFQATAAPVQISTPTPSNERQPLSKGHALALPQVSFDARGPTAKSDAANLTFKNWDKQHFEALGFADGPKDDSTPTALDVLAKALSKRSLGQIKRHERQRAESAATAAQEADLTIQMPAEAPRKEVTEDYGAGQPTHEAIEMARAPPEAPQEATAAVQTSKGAIHPPAPVAEKPTDLAQNAMSVVHEAEEAARLSTETASMTGGSPQYSATPVHAAVQTSQMPTNAALTNATRANAETTQRAVDAEQIPSHPDIPAVSNHTLGQRRRREKERVHKAAKAQQAAKSTMVYTPHHVPTPPKDHTPTDRQSLVITLPVAGNQLQGIEGDTNEASEAAPRVEQSHTVVSTHSTQNNPLQPSSTLSSTQPGGRVSPLSSMHRDNGAAQTHTKLPLVQSVSFEPSANDLKDLPILELIPFEDEEYADAEVKWTPKKRIITSFGPTHQQRCNVLLDIVRTAGGTFPGESQMWHAFTTKWLQTHPGTPEIRTVSKVIQTLRKEGKLNKYEFKWESSSGSENSYYILTEPEIGPSSIQLKKCQWRMIDVLPHTYMPAAVELTDALRKKGRFRAVPARQKRPREEESVQYETHKRRRVFTEQSSDAEYVDGGDEGSDEDYEMASSAGERDWRDNFKPVDGVTVKRTAAGLNISNAEAQRNGFADANARVQANALMGKISYLHLRRDAMKVGHLVSADELRPMSCGRDTESADVEKLGSPPTSHASMSMMDVDASPAPSLQWSGPWPKGVPHRPQGARRPMLGDDVGPLLSLLFYPQQLHHTRSGTIGTLSAFNGKAPRGSAKSMNANAGPSTASRKRKADETHANARPTATNLLMTPGQRLFETSWTIGTNGVVDVSPQVNDSGRGKRIKKSTEKAREFGKLQAAATPGPTIEPSLTVTDASPHRLWNLVDDPDNGTVSTNYTKQHPEESWQHRGHGRWARLGSTPMVKKSTRSYEQPDLVDDTVGTVSTDYAKHHPETAWYHHGNDRWARSPLQTTKKAAAPGPATALVTPTPTPTIQKAALASPATALATPAPATKKAAPYSQSGLFDDPNVSVSTDYVNSHPEETWHHRGKGRWARGLPPPGSTYKTAVKGPEAAAYLASIKTSEGKAKRHGAVVNGVQLKKNGEPWKRQPVTVNGVRINPADPSPSASPARTPQSSTPSGSIATVQYEVPPPVLTSSYSKTSGSAAGTYYLPQPLPTPSFQSVEYGVSPYTSAHASQAAINSSMIGGSVQAPAPPTPDPPFQRVPPFSATPAPSQPPASTKRKRPYTYKSRKQLSRVGPDGVPVELDRASDDDYMQSSSPKRQRKNSLLKNSPAKSKYSIDRKRLSTAVALVRNLSSTTVANNVRWDLVGLALQLDDRGASAEMQYRSITNHGSHAMFAKTVQEKMQELFLAALESGELPHVDLANLDESDWSGLLRWAEQNVVPQVLEEIVKIAEKKGKPGRPPGKGQKAKAKPKARKPIVDTITMFPATYNPEPKVPSSDLDLKEDLIVAKSCIRANSTTKDEMYNTDKATEKLTALGAPIIQAVEEMQQTKSIRQLKSGRQRPGRNFEITQHVWDQFVRWPGDAEGEAYLRNLANARTEIVQHFTGNETFEMPSSVSEQKTLILSSLLAQGMLKMEVKLPPRNDDIDAPFPKLNAWSYCGPRHNTKRVDRAIFDLPIVYSKTATFSAQHGLRSDVPIPTLPQALPNETLPRVPFWIDIHGDVIPEIWEKVLSSTIFLLVRTPGITAKGIEKAHANKLWVWEVEMALVWMEKVGVAERFGAGREVDRVWKGGWTVGEEWYCVLTPEVVGWR